MSTISKSSLDAVIIGSGPAGAIIARDLARKKMRVLILEQGSAAPLTGTLRQMVAMAAVPGKGAFINADGSLLVRGVTTGGSSAINFATAMAPPLPLFAKYGIDLGPALDALRLELPMAPLPDKLLGPMAQRLMQSARALGHDWRKLDKMIWPDQCRPGCWRCAYGCPFGAKWSARHMVEQAIESGAQLLPDSRAQRVLIKDGRAVGIEYFQDRKLHQVHADIIVLAAGGIGSPRLLYASGLAPDKAAHFSDPVIAVMGAVDDIDGGAEVPMAAGMHLEAEGITLADMTLPRPMYQAFAAQAGRLDRLLAHRRTLTVMVKIRDDIGGAIGPRWISKTLQPSDRDKLQRGVALARQILVHSGARHIFKSLHFAAHPGGSVRIGGGVDSKLETATPNLFVCDASVIPEAWGLPPTLTLLCLGKRLASHLALEGGRS